MDESFEPQRTRVRKGQLLLGKHLAPTRLSSRALAQGWRGDLLANLTRCFPPAAPPAPPPSTSWMTSAPCLTPWLTSWMPCWTELDPPAGSIAFALAGSLLLLQARGCRHCRSRGATPWEGAKGALSERGISAESRPVYNLSEEPYSLVGDRGKSFRPGETWWQSFCAPPPTSVSRSCAKGLCHRLYCPVQRLEEPCLARSPGVHRTCK